MRALGLFWAVLLVVLAIGAGVLQWLGPLPAGAGSTRLAASGAPAMTTGRGAGAPIPPPDPALLEPSASFPGHMLPRIGPDGRAPRTVYAAGVPIGRPLVAILLAGIGTSDSDSMAAEEVTPPAVSLAVSPYAERPEPLLEQARHHGREIWVAIPMEPRGYPLDDPGNRALLTGNTEALNAQRLEWALSRFGGYVGATGALGALHGERLADSPAQFQPVLRQLSQRGLMYVDPRAGAVLPDDAPGRAVDAVLDDTPSAAAIDAQLHRLEDMARNRGQALGLISVPRPVAVERLAAWAEGLAGRGVTLAPVSAVIPARATAAVPMAAQEATP